MSQPSPFDTIEGAQEFLKVLTDTIAEAKQEVQAALVVEGAQASRRRDALQIAAYSLEKLQGHMVRSHVILNDLRSLRRLLFAEREAAQPQPVLPEPIASKPKPVVSGKGPVQKKLAVAAGD